MTVNTFLNMVNKTDFVAPIVIFNENENSKSLDLLSEAFKHYKDKLGNAKIYNICINGKYIQLTINLKA